MSNALLTEAAKKHGTKATGGGMLGILIYLVFQLQAEVKEVRKQVNDIHTQVVVLDAIRQNEQWAARKRYE